MIWPIVSNRVKRPWAMTVDSVARVEANWALGHKQRGTLLTTGPPTGATLDRVATDIDAVLCLANLNHHVHPRAAEGTRALIRGCRSLSNRVCDLFY